MTPVASLDGVACPVPLATSTSTSIFGELQLPIADARGRPARIVGSELQGYSSFYMERRGNRLVFRVPRGDGQTTTAHSGYPRSELKEGRIWRMGDGCAVQAARVTVAELPVSGRVVIGQIHQVAAVPRPPVELVYADGALFASVMTYQTERAAAPRTRVDLAADLRLGVSFTYVLALNRHGLLTMSVDGRAQSFRLDPSFATAHLYFKAGLYPQDRGGGGVVVFDGLAVDHAPPPGR